MDIQEAKIAKVNAEEKILRIIENLEDETKMTVVDAHYSSELISVVMEQSVPVHYMKKIKLVLEI